MADNKKRGFIPYSKSSRSSKSSKTSKSNSRTSSSSSSSSSSIATKAVKKLSKAAKLAMVMFFILGVAASYFVCGFLCKNDCFEINGKKSTVITVGEEYVDSGAKVITFGMDATNKLDITVYENNTLVGGLEDIDTSRATTYQIVYKVSSMRFKDVQLIRTLTVLENEEVAPEEDAYNGENTTSTNLVKLEINLNII